MVISFGRVAQTIVIVLFISAFANSEVLEKDTLSTELSQTPSTTKQSFDAQRYLLLPENVSEVNQLLDSNWKPAPLDADAAEPVHLSSETFLTFEKTYSVNIDFGTLLRTIYFKRKPLMSEIHKIFYIFKSFEYR